MKKVTSADSLVTINHYKNVLISEGIPAFIRNEHLGGILGEMPFQEVWPELWVENDWTTTARCSLSTAITYCVRVRNRPGVAAYVRLKMKDSLRLAGSVGRCKNRVEPNFKMRFDPIFFRAYRETKDACRRSRF